MTVLLTSLQLPNKLTKFAVMQTHDYRWFMNERLLNHSGKYRAVFLAQKLI